MILWLITAAVTLAGVPTEQDTTAARSSPRLNTTHPSLSLVFEYAGSPPACTDHCEHYRLWLTFRGLPVVGAPEATDWRRVADSSCMDVRTNKGASFMCALTGAMSGRDRAGTDYVLLRLRATREQIAVVATDPAAKFVIGGVEFQLGQESRAALTARLSQLAVVR
jgi:hypothetical protein